MEESGIETEENLVSLSPTNMGKNDEDISLIEEEEEEEEEEEDLTNANQRKKLREKSEKEFLIPFPGSSKRLYFLHYSFQEENFFYWIFFFLFSFASFFSIFFGITSFVGSIVMVGVGLTSNVVVDYIICFVPFFLGFFLICLFLMSFYALVLLTRMTYVEFDDSNRVVVVKYQFLHIRTTRFALFPWRFYEIPYFDVQSFHVKSREKRIRRRRTDNSYYFEDIDDDEDEEEEEGGGGGGRHGRRKRTIRKKLLHYFVGDTVLKIIGKDSKGLGFVKLNRFEGKPLTVAKAKKNVAVKICHNFQEEMKRRFE